MVKRDQEDVICIRNDLQLTEGPSISPEEEEGANEKSIQSWGIPLMDEQHSLTDEKALSLVASWLLSSLFLACNAVEIFSIRVYGIYKPADTLIINWSVFVVVEASFWWGAIDFSLGMVWIFFIKIEWTGEEEYSKHHFPWPMQIIFV